MKITVRRIILGLALAAGLSLAAAAPANAASYQYYGAEASVPATGSSAFVQFNAAYSTYIVSIKSNYVNCPVFSATRTWCGTAGNNTGHAQGGVNFKVNGTSYYLRLDVYAPASSPTGHLYCTTRGNTPSHFPTSCNGVAT
jgi:hypothetical protein